MEIYDLKTEHLNSPIGIDEARPLLSWKISSDKKDTMQKSYRIVVRQQNNTVWESGEVESSQSVCVEYSGMPLKAFTPYTWQVSVSDNHGDMASSETAVFETGRMGTTWTAKWISTAGKRDDDAVTPTHLYEKIIRIDKAVTKARLYISALGVYAASIGDRQVQEHYLTPGYTDYNRHVQYQAYDVTNLLTSGENVLKCELAGGWYTGKLGLVLKRNRYGKKRALILELHIYYEDGSKEIIASDESFQYTCDGPRRYAELFDGEVYDANREEAIWQYQNAELWNGKTPRIVSDIGMPVKKHATIAPKAFHLLNNSVIYDFGKNFAGFIRIELDAPKGDIITIKHGEILDKDKDLYTTNLRTAKAQLVYISKGGLQVYEPRFTYMGFRFVKVEGIDPSKIKNIMAYELYSDLDITGTFSCSNEQVNQLQENIMTTQKANFMDIPTDCPQRDERVCWTGDIALYSKTAAFNMDVSRFMRKWLRDLRSEQHRNLGNIPFVIPSNNIFWMRIITSPIWSDAAVIVPWDACWSTGDLRLLKESYASMKQWVKTMKRISTFGKLSFMKNYYVCYWFSFGDWVAPGITMKEQVKRGKWLSTAFFANSAALTAKAARLLGRIKDAEKYEKLNEKISKSFCKTFLDAGGHIRNGFQSAYVLALHFGMLPAEAHQAAVEDLVKDIAAHDNHLTTGFPGTPYITFALADNGRADTAYNLLMQESCPSWLYPVKCGATSIWERWDAIREDGSVNETPQAGKENMVSLSHYAYGAIGDFLYSRIAGIEAVEAGYKHFKIAPIVGDGLSYVKASYESPYGMIRSEWTIQDNIFHLSVTVPANTTATVRLPNKQEFSVGSGEYEFTCEMR